MVSLPYSNVRGTVRGVTSQSYADASGDGAISLNERGDLIVAQSLPPLAEQVRLGNTWGILSAAVDSLNAIPTTTAPHSLFNGEAATGKCYVIESFGAFEVVVDATEANNTAIVAMVTAGTVAAPTDAGLGKWSMSGRTTNNTSARTVAGATVVDQWMPHAPNTHIAGAVAGSKFRVNEVQANGLYIVRPGGLFSWGAVKLAAVTGQMRFFVRWHEVPLSFVS
jgi:hypothetical protein